jgi:hypothetical protein
MLRSQLSSQPPSILSQASSDSSSPSIPSQSAPPSAPAAPSDPVTARLLHGSRLIKDTHVGKAARALLQERNSSSPRYSNDTTSDSSS